mmetsp:Transcript_8799/g.21719  ORF Transcript_8799/g.21719 Transcript_8799/m.21719 type:complete len:115 (-) Transcript_8799:151-495(-)
MVVTEDRKLKKKKGTASTAADVVVCSCFMIVRRSKFDRQQFAFNETTRTRNTFIAEQTLVRYFLRRKYSVLFPSMTKLVYLKFPTQQQEVTCVESIEDYLCRKLAIYKIEGNTR